MLSIDLYKILLLKNIKQYTGEEKMRKRAIGIFVCMMLLITATLAVAVNVDEIKPTSRGWSEKQKLLATDGSGDDRFGSSVDINGYDAIIGAYFDDVSTKNNAGSAYVFIYTGSSWTQQAKLTASDADNDDEFGISVSIDGDYAIVGAHKEDGSGTDRGAAYVFYRSGTTWTQQQKLTPGDTADNDFFGKSVSIDGEYAIVGCPGKNSNQGFSYIFKRTGTVWSQMTKVGATGSNKLGWSVSISMPCVIMGAYGTNSNTGAAHIYELQGSSWYGKGALTASDGVSADLFGISVSIDSDYAICGSPGHDLTYGGEGAAYIFEKPGTGWATMTETQKITASDNEGGDGFGQSVSVDGDGIFVAAPYEDGTGNARGAGYIFNRGSSSWSEAAKVIASDAANDDYFGWGVSISGNSAISGAYADDNTNGVDAGSAYIFEWTNQAPSTPTINGPTSGIPGTPYNYKFKSTDPDGDQVSYYVKWGDNTNTGWFGPFDSGVEQTKSHSWSSTGTYIIEAKAKDVHDAESGWGTLTVTIPKTKAMNMPFLRFLENYPTLYQIIKTILEK